MQNKRKLALLPLVALLGLAGCSNSVDAHPTDYNDPLVVFNGSKEESLKVYHNIAKIVEDSYHDGSLASDVLTRVLYQYAVSIFGRYNKIAEGFDDADSNEITLKAAVASARSNGDKSNANAFINKHKAYWTTNKDGKRINDNGDVVTGDVDASDSEIARLEAKWDAIEDLIAEKMFNAISGGSYSDRGIFEEQKYVESLVNSGKAVTAAGDYADPTVLRKNIEWKDVFSKLLKRDHYQKNYKLTDAEVADETVKYVEETLIPDIYNSLLVNQYLVDKKYSALGSSYARKVNVFSITSKSEFPKQDDYFMDSLIKLINAEPAIPAPGDQPVRNTINKEVFARYSNAWNGIFTDEDIDPVTTKPSIKILDDINAQDSNLFVKELEGGSADSPYYVGTDYGELIKRYHKLDDLNDPSKYRLVDSSIVSEFTNSGAYNKEIGREIKTQDILVKDNVTSGWYISNGGLSSLPDAIRSRLFSFSVATAFKEDPHMQDLEDRWQYNDAESKWEYAVPEGESSYLARINGAYYLKNTSSSQGSDPRNDILFHDNSSSTYYVIQVCEAVRSTKIVKDPTAVPGQDPAYDNDKREQVINEICKCVAGTESYTSLAKKYWLEQMSLEYHDTTVYDYFKANYPELFD